MRGSGSLFSLCLTSHVGGRLRLFLDAWGNLTGDEYVLRNIQGHKIEFINGDIPPSQHMPGRTFKLSAAEQAAGYKEILSLEQKGVIEKTVHEPIEFVSNIFTRPKKDGGCRVIIDLTRLNTFVTYTHFKMDTFETAKSLISHGCFMACIDLRDAYYSVSIQNYDRRFLKFIWMGQLWQYKALPNGLTTAPRLFTKLVKPIMAYLRQRHHIVMAYLDDVFIVGHTLQLAEQGVAAAVNIFQQLGFIVHPEKSKFCPAQVIDYLGFTVNSLSMRITIPINKIEEVTQVCRDLIGTNIPSIRHTATVIGKLVALFPAARYGPLHYQNLQRAKIIALKRNAGHYDRSMQLPSEAITELQWWVCHISNSFKPVREANPVVYLQTDASSNGWGATDNCSSCGGRWDTLEASMLLTQGINYLELLAAFHGLRAYCSKLVGAHVRLQIDNTTAVAYLNHMGGTRSVSCDKLANSIWLWCVQRDIWISATYLPGELNTVADTRSRKFNDNIEWMLHPEIFSKVTAKFGKPDIDLFASRLNHQVPAYVSWEPDPGAIALDAFSLDWGNWFFYAFPPFCLISRVLRKIQADAAKGILIIPDWPTQPWYPVVFDMLNEPWVLLRGCPQLVTHPVSGEPHPCHGYLNLLACRF